MAPDERSHAATLAVVGIPSGSLPSRSEVEADQWPSILRVTVVQEGETTIDVQLPPVAGSYTVTGNAIVFTPTFGFDPGVRYRAVFDPSQLPSAPVNQVNPVNPVIVAIVGLPKTEFEPTTMVEHVFPSAEVVPENQLRLYVQFSAPMGRKGGLDHIHLIDADGREVQQPFLPLEGEFWNTDRTRYTVFFDPGRVKRGILPNVQMGRPLVAGRKYTLVVDREWRDGNGVPLRQAFRRSFRAGPADERPLDQKAWRLNAPAAGSHDPLTVTFPEPLDHGLLMRALGVTTADGRRLSGSVAIAARETQWTFTPEDPWKAGDYQLIALTILEDMAGNRIGRAFEVDQFEQVDAKAEEERVTVAFRIR